MNFETYIHKIDNTDNSKSYIILYLPQLTSSSPFSQSMSLSHTQWVGIQVHSPGLVGSQRNRFFLQLQGISLSTLYRAKTQNLDKLSIQADVMVFILFSA